MGATDRNLSLQGYVPSSAAGCRIDRYGDADGEDWADADDLDGRGRGSDSCSRLEEGHRCCRSSRSCGSYDLKEVDSEVGRCLERRALLVTKTVY